MRLLILLLLLCAPAAAASLDTCISSCDGKCIMDENGDHSCSKVGFFEKLIDGIKGFFQSDKPVDYTEITVVDEDKKEDIEKKVWEDVLGFEADHDTKKGLFQLIENADMGDLFQLKSLIDQYCYIREREDYKESCASLYAALKKKGDELKDDEFAAIKQDDPDMVKKLEELQAFLMAQRTATGKDTLFSTDNVKMVNRKTKEMMRERNRKIVDEGDLTDLLYEYVLLMAAETATGEEKENDAFGLFGKGVKDMKEKVKARLQQVLLKRVEEIDVCDPDPEKLQKLIDDMDGLCNMFLPDDICTKIKKGDLEEVYTWMGGEIDCSKGTSGEISINQTDINITQVIDKAIEEVISEMNITSGQLSDAGDYKEINRSGADDVTTGMEEYVPEDTGPLEPEFPEIIIFYDDPLIGWDFESEIPREDVEACILQCGFEIPLQVVDEGLCYDRMQNSEVPCEPRPMIPDDVQGCTIACAEELSNI